MDLVLSYCDLTWDHAGPFVRSLRKTGFRGDIVFLGGTQDPITRQKYDEFGVSLYGHGRVDDYTDAIVFLESHLSDYKKVFTSDARDVIFQINPSLMFLDRGLHLFEEDLTIGEQDLNAHWMRSAYGHNVLEMLRKQKILCGGTVFGGAEAVLNYVKELQANFRVSSQTTLNYLYYLCDRFEAFVHRNDGTSVWTIGTKIDTVSNRFYKLEGGYIKTLEGDVPYAVHQYDRHPELLQFVQERYR